MTKFYKNIDKVLLLFLLAPFYLISIFNNPASDDFDFGFKTRDYGYFGSQVYRYMNEGGRYFSNGIISLNPLVIKAYWMFKILPILVLGLFVYSVFYFFSNVFRDFEKSIRLRFAVVFIFIYFAQLVEVSSAFYWFAGAMTYQLPASLSLLFFGTLAKYNYDKNSSLLFILCMLLIMIMGCNEITSILYLVGVLFFWLLLKVTKKQIPIYFYLFLFIVLLFAGVELLAPGNSERAKTINVPEKHQFINSVFKTGLNSLKFLFKWFPLLFLTSLYIFPLFRKKKFENLYLSIGIAFATIFLGMFPGFWTTNSVLPERAQNLIYFYFIFSGIYFGLVFIHFFEKKYNQIVYYDLNKIIFMCLLLFSFSNTAIYDVYNDLITLKAYRFNKEMTNRYQTIESTKEKQLVLPSLSLLARPKTIYSEKIMGLTNSNLNWKNLELKDFYHKEIVIQPTDSIFTE